MKTLSIKQPYAYLIASGIKDIENRSWKTNFRGRIYIHASGTDLDEYKVKLTHEQINSFLKSNLPTPTKLPKQAIIGEVDIVDCVINYDSIWAEHMETHYDEDIPTLKVLNKGQKYIWNWVLANPVLYDKPILNVKGKLSFWEFEPIQEC